MPYLLSYSKRCNVIAYVNLSEKTELFNIWSAYLNFEVMMGSNESLNDIFHRACSATDSLTMHKQLVKGLQNHPDASSKDEVILKFLESYFQFLIRIYAKFSSQC